MRSVTIKQAKAHLNELIDAAERGEQVVLLRGSKHVATIVPITDADLDVRTELGDAQAARLWHEVRAAEKSGAILRFASPEAAVLHLSDSKKMPRLRPAARGVAKKAHPR